MSLVDTLSLGFTYLSPLAGIFSLLAFALSTGGPPSLWWLFIVAGGQKLVALVFGEIVSQYPITGGIYPWARRLWGARYAWMVAWIYLCALVVVITSLVEYGVPFVASLFSFTAGTGLGLFIALGFLVVALIVNLSGTKWLARVAKLGFYAEIVGVLALGTYLFLFERKNDFSVIFDTMGASSTGYASGFFAASLLGLYLYYGFEACGDVAEEVDEPERVIPRAMILTIVLGATSAVVATLGYMLAAPDLQGIVDGDVVDPIPQILQGSVGTYGTKVFLVVALTAFVSCTLSLQAALSRLLFSFGRDRMLPGSEWLSRLNGEQVPRNAIVVATIAPGLACLYLYARPDDLVRITSFAILGIYLCFQLVVFAALRQRVLGWRPSGDWNLGRAGAVVNVVALMYGIAAMVLLARPGDASLPFIDRWVVLLGLGLVLIVGLAYMVATRPYRHSDAPTGDALKVAAELNARRREAKFLP